MSFREAEMHRATRLCLCLRDGVVAVVWLAARLFTWVWIAGVVIWPAVLPLRLLNRWVLRGKCMGGLRRVEGPRANA